MFPYVSGALARAFRARAFGLRGHIFGFCFSAGLPREVGPVWAPQQNIHRHIIMIHGILSSGVVGTLRFRGSPFLQITHTLQMAVYVLFRERQGGETCPWSPTGLPSRAGARAKYCALCQIPLAFKNLSKLAEKRLTQKVHGAFHQPPVGV